MHIPWCVRKCPYCDFNSHKAVETLPETAYVDALLKDLERDLPLVWGRSVSTVFIGGGTPSLFSPEAIDRLIRGIRARLPLISRAEITMEANPGTVEQHKFKEFRATGINRLSIGIQSFNSRFLERLGRIHSGEEAYRAFEVAEIAGFENVNLDLMFALPGQTADEASVDLAEAIRLGPQHISYYQLTLEPNTWFYQHPPKLPTDELQWRMQNDGIELLDASGYERYEVSAYARPVRQCQHNLNYWEFGDYLGIGAGAHSKLTLPQEQQILRQGKQRQPAKYLQLVDEDSALGSTTNVAPEDIVFEFMLNALRKVEGVRTDLFLQRTGLELSMIKSQLELLRRKELVLDVPDRIQCTKLGLQFLNEVVSTFLPETASNQAPNTSSN